ncbi:hypothetical protein [Vibrio maerlii]|uniref:hypothetical protein n=1 Tax=Vibrio maerlii TaxID=2231648 RepID=UPI000F4DC352|nr:hypothetical protein [Vibrio maerlii]
MERLSNLWLPLSERYQYSIPPFQAFSRLVHRVPTQTSAKGVLEQLAAIAQGETVAPPKLLKQLDTDSIYISMPALRIDLQELSTFLDSENDSITTVNVETVEPNIDSITHPIEQIVFRILKEKPSLRADKIWRLLQRDANSELRTLDSDNVISEMNAQHLEWFGAGANDESSMSYDSFRKGLVPRVKNKMKNRTN